jgi:hypothetical protein
MEESNYTRSHVAVVQSVNAQDSAGTADNDSSAASPEKLANAHEPTTEEEGDINSPRLSKKTYVQKLALFRRSNVRRSASLLTLMARPFIFLQFPVIVFAGFTYGAFICYFNILNGTASILLSSPPYSFSPSMVGLSYVSCVIGAVVG